VNEVDAAAQVGFPILSTLIVVPLLVIVALALVRNERRLRPVALAGASVELALALVVVGRFRTGAAEFQLAERVPWIDALGASYHVAVDGISVLFLPLTGLLVFLVVLLSSGTVRYQPKPYLMAVLAFESVAMGVFVAVDLLVFFVFFQLLLVPSFIVMKAWGTGPERTAAGLKYVLYMLTGSAALLVGFILLGINHQRVSGVLSFDLLELMDVGVPAGTQTTVFFLLALAFALKAPLFPFHGWMPAALGEGPIGLAVLLAGLKMGVYGFLRFVIPLVPDAFSAWAWLIAALGVVAVLYGALIALVEPSLTRLIAFAGVSHVGMAMLGLASLNTQGVQGALFLVVDLGLTSTAMLIVAGFLYHRFGGTDIAALGGIATRAPALALFGFVACIGAIAVPGTSGFPGEFLVLLGAFDAYSWVAGIAVLTVILTAAYTLVFYERAFHGRVTSEVVDATTDLRPREATAALVIGTAIIVFGFFPGLLLGVSSGSVDIVVERLAVGVETVTLAWR
jgi:NADH-quinone oxidoreductase subunit M